MDSSALKSRAERLLEVSKLIEQLPSEIRSQAFEMLSPYIIGKSSSEASRNREADRRDEVPPLDIEDRESFFTQFPHDKPADNVKLIAAWWYNEHGTAPITPDNIRQFADDVGLTVPNRLDMTLKASLEDGKNLFTRAGRGTWKPTVHGEHYLKKTYSVKKGKKPVEPTKT